MLGRSGDGVLLSEAGLQLLQHLCAPEVLDHDDLTLPFEDIPALQRALQAFPLPVWLGVERALRHYLEYYLERPIRSAALIDTCFQPDAAVTFVTP